MLRGGRRVVCKAGLLLALPPRCHPGEVIFTLRFQLPPQQNGHRKRACCGRPVDLIKKQTGGALRLAWQLHAVPT